MSTPWIRLVALALCMPAAQAQEPGDTQAERTRISAERRQAEARFAAEEKDCYGRFAVNDCIADARARQREVLSDLRRQENSLAEVERKRRGAERMEDLRERAAQREQQGAAGGAAAAAPAAQDRREPKGVPSATAPGERTLRPPAAAATPQRQPRERSIVDEAANRRDHEARLREAREHKERALARSADRAKRSAPLPVPP